MVELVHSRLEKYSACSLLWVVAALGYLPHIGGAIAREITDLVQSQEAISHLLLSRCVDRDARRGVVWVSGSDFDLQRGYAPKKERPEPAVVANSGYVN